MAFAQALDFARWPSPLFYCCRSVYPIKLRARPTSFKKPSWISLSQLFHHRVDPGVSSRLSSQFLYYVTSSKSFHFSEALYFYLKNGKNAYTVGLLHTLKKEKNCVKDPANHLAHSRLTPKENLSR